MFMFTICVHHITKRQIHSASVIIQFDIIYNRILYLIQLIIAIKILVYAVQLNASMAPIEG